MHFYTVKFQVPDVLVSVVRLHAFAVPHCMVKRLITFNIIPITVHNYSIALTNALRHHYVWHAAKQSEQPADPLLHFPSRLYSVVAELPDPPRHLGYFLSRCPPIQ